MWEYIDPCGHFIITLRIFDFWICVNILKSLGNIDLDVNKSIKS